MLQHELLKRLVHAVEQGGVQYMLNGSVVSSMQGQPRLTHDIDIVVDLKHGEVEVLAVAFPEPEFYLDKTSLREAISRGGMANVIELGSGIKIDLWMLTDDAFDESRFARRRRVDVEGVEAYVSSPEDTILQKLRWSREIGGNKQFRDALMVYEVQQQRLDQGYLDQWAARLGVQEQLEDLRKQAGRGEDNT